MSNLSMNQTEEQAIDNKIEQMMDWAQNRQIEAEQLALDSARLMACTTDRLDRLSKQGFYKRCWSRFNGDAGAMERATVNDVIQMQKMAFRYVNMLQEQQLLMAHSLLSLKNNLNSLAVKEEETRNLIAMLAQRTLERFEQLEGRVGKLETSSNLHDWLFTLEERDYEEKIPTDYMRLLRVINDFYDIKNDNWNNNDLMFMRKAIRTVGLNPKEKLSINAFIDKLADEIQSSEVGFDAYDKAITLFAPEGMENYSQFAIENVSSPVFASLHGLNTQYRDKMDAVEALQNSLSISTSDALKTLLRQSIKGMNVNLDYEFPLAETAIEILGCMRLTEKLPESKASSAKADQEVINLASKEQELAQNDTLICATLEELAALSISALQANSFIRKRDGTILSSPPAYLNGLLKKLDGLQENEILAFVSDGNRGLFAGKEGKFGIFNMMEGVYLYTDAASENLKTSIQAYFERFSGELTEAMRPPLQILEGFKGIERTFEVIMELARNDEPLDRKCSYANTPKGALGKLPENFNEITATIGHAIDPEALISFVSNGKLGFFATLGEYGDMGYIGSFDLTNNIYSISEPDVLDKISGTKEEEQLMKKFGGSSSDEIMGEVMQKFQEKIVQTFPEIRGMFG